MKRIICIETKHQMGKFSFIQPQELLSKSHSKIDRARVFTNIPSVSFP